MTTDPGRPDATDSAIDRARIDYLSGDLDAPTNILSDGDRAELDDLRTLLADPTWWAEPPADLEDAVVTAVAAEATARSSSGVADDADPAPVTHVAPGLAPAGTDPVSPAPPIDLAAARSRRRTRTGRSGWTRPTMLVAAAAALIVMVAGAVLLLRPPAQRTFDVAFQATDLAPTASGNAVMTRTDSGWRIELEVTGLPRLDNGQFYQGWLRNADGVLVPIGTFNEGTDVVLWSGVSPDQFPTLTVTREQADGDQTSSGQRVLVGTAVEVK